MASVRDGTRLTTRGGATTPDMVVVVVVVLLVVVVPVVITSWGKEETHQYKVNVSFISVSILGGKSFSPDLIKSPAALER